MLQTRETLNLRLQMIHAIIRQPGASQIKRNELLCLRICETLLGGYSQLSASKHRCIENTDMPVTAVRKKSSTPVSPSEGLSDTSIFTIDEKLRMCCAIALMFSSSKLQLLRQRHVTAADASVAK